MKIFVKVKPLAKEEKAEKIDNNNFKVSVKEPPVGGRANRAVEKVIADYFGLPRSSVRIISGFASKLKIIEIS